MSPEAQRIAIAKHCPLLVEWHDGLPYWQGSWSAVGQGNESFAEFDPCCDLNAMREAEEVLCVANGPWQKYLSNLWLAVHPSWPDPKPVNIVNYLARDFVRATAAQRAEAFLRTLDLWTP